MNGLKLLLTKNFYITILITFLVLMMICIVALLDSPYTGLNYEYHDGGWYISSVDLGSPASGHPGLQGSHVISVAGLTLTKHDLEKEFDDIITRQDFVRFFDTQKYFSENIRIGIPLEIIVQKNGITGIESLIPSQYPLYQFIYKAGIIFAVGIISTLTGLVVVLRGVNEPRAVLFFFLTLFMGSVDIPLGVFTARDTGFDFNAFLLLFIINTPAIFLTAAAMFHFCLIFPEYKKISKNIYFIYAIYIGAIISAFLFGSRLSYYIYPAFVLPMIFGGLAAIIHSYMTVTSPVTRAQVKIVLLGAMLALITFPLIYFIPMLMMGHRVVSAHIPMLTTLLLPLSMGFAIIRYRLMDIDSLFDATVIHIITVVLLSMIDIAIASALTHLKIQNIHITDFAANVAAIWTVLLLYLPVRDMVARFIKQLMKRDIYNLHEVSLRLNKKLLAANSVPDTFNVVTDTIQDILHPSGWDILIRKEDGSFSLYNTGGNGAPIPVSWAGGIDIQRSEPLYNIPGAGELPEYYSGGVIIPIVGQKGVLCYILLRNKESGRLYSNEETQLFDIISVQAGMCLDAITLREEAGLEKERMSREIHDGIGNNLAQAIVLSNLSEKKPGMISNLRNLLTESLNNLRELIWTIEPGHSTLKDLCAYISDNTQHLADNDDIEIITDIHIENQAIPVSSQIKLNLIRIVQESLTNILKHSEAKLAEITLVEKNGELIIRIFDNGKGFNTFRANGNGYGIRNIKKRCEAIGCRYEINSEPGTGTEVLLELQLADISKDKPPEQLGQFR